MICIPGHGPGRVKPIALGVRAEGNRDYGLQALRAGFAVAVIEMRGQGSLRIAGKGAASGMSFDCTKTAAQWEAVGKPLAGQWVNDVSSVVSWLDTMPDFDGSRIGIVGQSLGGAVALYAGACDERIRCVITSGFFAPMADSCLDHNYHSCPACLPHGLREHFDLPDIAALIAPRSLMVIVGDRDVAPVDSIREGFAITRAVYHNRADCILSVNEGAHAFYPDGVWEFATDALD
jgi:dienelactone hydrolase